MSMKIRRWKLVGMHNQQTRKQIAMWAAYRPSSLWHTHLSVAWCRPNLSIQNRIYSVHFLSCSMRRLETLFAITNQGHRIGFYYIRRRKKKFMQFFFSLKKCLAILLVQQNDGSFFCWGYLAVDKGFYHSYTQFPSFFSVAKNFSDEQKCNSKTNTKRNIIKHKSFAIKCLHWFW